MERERDGDPRGQVVLTWSRVGDGGRRHGDGNAAAAVLPAAASPAASTEKNKNLI